MSRVETLTAVIVETIPTQLEDGYLYVSRKYNTAVHRCCCGCGNRSVTPTTANGWKLLLTGDTPTLPPSVWQRRFPLPLALLDPRRHGEVAAAHQRGSNRIRPRT